MSRVRLFLLILATTALACGRGTAIQVAAPPGASRTPPTFPDDLANRDQPVPDSSGWGTHVLAVGVAPDGAVWVGTYGQGIYVSRDGAGGSWENIRSGDSTSISWDFVNAIAFAPGEVWYGTIGNGWGVSKDGGRTWRNWTFDELGARWLYVAPDGIAAAGDTIYVATADGLRITQDGGETYRDVTDENGLPNKYLLSLVVESPAEGATRVSVTHLRGASTSDDGGRTWQSESEAPGLRTTRESGVRIEHAALRADKDGDLRAGVIGPQPGEPDASREPSAPGKSGASSASNDLVHRIREWQRVFRDYPDPGGPAAQPGDVEHFWFRRPIADEDNPYLDQTYTYGSTMGGNFQQHQGVEFNNPEGTPVHAIGDGIVAYAGKAEAGANTVAVLHDRRFGKGYIWSTYYHNADLTVRGGQRVQAGDVIAHVGNTGRATNDHVHLEIHVTPTPDSTKVVDPGVRYPPYTRNPQLWIEPIPGTGAIAGRVLDSQGRPVPGARVYGVTKPRPRETPFSFAETYEDRAHADPAFGEHFAIGDVPAGQVVLGVEIEGRPVFRKVQVAAGKVTPVELRP